MADIICMESHKNKKAADRGFKEWRRLFRSITDFDEHTKWADLPDEIVFFFCEEGPESRHAFYDLLMRSHHLGTGHDFEAQAYDVARETGFDTEQVLAAILSGVARGEIIEIEGKGFFGKARFNALKVRIPEALNEFFTQNPLATAIKSAQIKIRLAPLLDDALLKKMLDDLSEEGCIERLGSGYHLPNFEVKLLPEQEKLAALLLRYARGSDLVPFGAGKFCKFNTRLGTFSIPKIQKILDHLHEQGKLIRFNDKRYLTPQAFEEIKKRVGEKILEAGSLILDDLKDLIGYGRTRAIPVLEYLDDIGFTVRMGDGRVLKSPDSLPVEEDWNREDEMMDGLNIRGEDEFDQDGFHQAVDQ